MYDLRIVVEEIKGFCDLPMKVGDFFWARGGRLVVPEGQHVCIWALQSMMPLIPAKQRESAEENDWVPHTHRICCPDPNGMVIYRLDRVPPLDETLPPEAGGEARVAEGVEAADGEGSGKSAAQGIARLLVREERCAGCRACELACSFAHERAYSERFARILVEKDEPSGVDRPVVCRQCGVARCIQACPNGALTKTPNHAIRVVEELCQGCGACAEACPFGAVRFVDGRVAPLICDLCDGDPQCVKRCSTGALVYGLAGERAAAGGRER